MAAAVSKEALLATKGLGTKEVEVPGVGTVVVRGLSRAEVVQMQAAGSPDAMENRMMAAAMVEPPLTVEEVVEWRAEAPSEVVRPISDAILALSGLVEGDQTAKERNFRPGRD